MDKEQRIAYILAQTACMYAKLEAMKSYDRLNAGGLQHTPEEYENLPAEFGIHHNQVIAYLLQY